MKKKIKIEIDQYSVKINFNQIKNILTFHKKNATFF